MAGKRPDIEREKINSRDERNGSLSKEHLTTDIPVASGLGFQKDNSQKTRLNPIRGLPSCVCSTVIMLMLTFDPLRYTIMFILKFKVTVLYKMQKSGSIF